MNRSTSNGSTRRSTGDAPRGELAVYVAAGRVLLVEDDTDEWEGGEPGRARVAKAATHDIRGKCALCWRGAHGSSSARDAAIRTRRRRTNTTRAAGRRPAALASSPAQLTLQVAVAAVHAAIVDVRRRRALARARAHVRRRARLRLMRVTLPVVLVQRFTRLEVRAALLTVEVPVVGGHANLLMVGAGGRRAERPRRQRRATTIECRRPRARDCLAGAL